MASTPSVSVPSILLGLLQDIAKASREGRTLSLQEIEAALKLAASLQERTDVEKLLDRVNELSDRLEAVEAHVGQKDWSPPLL